MSLSRKPVRLTVDGSLPSAEVFIIDGRLEIAVDVTTRKPLRGFGTLDAQLEPGAYLVKVKAGDRVAEKLISLSDKDQHVQFWPQQIPVLSATPLGESADAIEACWQAIERVAARVKPRRDAAQIALFIRASQSDALPRGLWLIDRDGSLREKALGPTEALVADGADWVAEAYREEIVHAISWSVAPGPYRLGMSFESVEGVERTVVATEGRATQIFMQTAPGAGFDEDRTTVLVGTKLGYDMVRDRELRLAETARAQLMTGRVLKESDLVGALLGGKFEEPMLGLYAAHLLLASEGPDSSLLRTVLGQLDRLIPQVPDVALLRSIVDRTVLDGSWFPPMLRASWDLYLRRSYEPDLRTQAEDSGLLGEISSRVMGQRSWLLWHKQRPRPVARLLNEVEIRLTGGAHNALVIDDRPAESAPVAEVDLGAIRFKLEERSKNLSLAHALKPAKLKLSALERNVLEAYLDQQELTPGRRDFDRLVAEYFGRYADASEVQAELMKALDRFESTELVGRFRVTRGMLNRAISTLSAQLTLQKRDHKHDDYLAPV